MTFLRTIAATLFLVGGTAQAAPVVFESSFAIDSIGGTGANGAGLSVGDVIDWAITVENGGGLESNSWSDAQVVSALATSGSYKATFIAPYFFPRTIFTTNAAGVVTMASWFDAGDVPNLDFDAFGFGADASQNALVAGDGTFYFYVGGSVFGDANKWSARLVDAPVPLPAGLPLLLAGLGGLALIRTRRG